MVTTTSYYFYQIIFFLCNLGQNSQQLEYLFTGEMLGHKSDIADGSLRGYEFRKFENIVGDYYVAPKFLEAIAVRLE